MIPVTDLFISYETANFVDQNADSCQQILSFSLESKNNANYELGGWDFSMYLDDLFEHNVKIFV